MYFRAKDIDDAMKLIAEHPDFLLMCGSTDVAVQLKKPKSVNRIIDISALNELQYIKIASNTIHIGALTTITDILESTEVRAHLPLLFAAVKVFGSHQIRNVATIGGNVSHALPAGDGTIALLPLDTEVEIASSEGDSWQPLIDIFAGPGKVNFDRSSSLVVGFRFAAKGIREGSAFHRVMRPQGVAIAILNMAAWVKLSEDGKIEQVRISCGPAGPKPFRANKTEEYLDGKSWSESAHQAASKILAEEVSLRTSAHRATKEYRHQLLPVLLREVLDTALDRANN